MAELGVGVRVFVGWTPDNEVGCKGARCSLATIIDGPHKNEEWVPLLCKINATSEVVWVVDNDNAGQHWAVESLLFPVDDGDPVEIEQEDEVTA